MDNTQSSSSFLRKLVSSVKGWLRLCYGENKMHIFWTSKFIISGLECRRMFKLVLVHTMDPSGPFWGAHLTEKYVHTKAYPLEKFRRKMTPILGPTGFGNRWGAKCQKILIAFQLRSNPLRNWFIASPCTSNRFCSPKRKISEIHF